MRTRLLAAIDTASGDILHAHGGPAPAGGTWQSSAYPQPGQEVHFHVLGLRPDGTPAKDGEYSFRMPSENEGANSYTSNIDQGGLQLSGTIMAVNHDRHTWAEWHGNFIPGFTLDAAGIRAEIANGQFKVVGSTELHRQQAVELEFIAAAQQRSPAHVTTARLRVDATTYLPMQQFMGMSNWRAERHGLHLPPANGREPGETAPGKSRRATSRFPEGRGACSAETEDGEEVATSATVRRPAAEPLKTARHRARDYRPVSLVRCRLTTCRRGQPLVLARAWPTRGLLISKRPKPVPEAFSLVCASGLRWPAFIRVRRD